MCVHRSAHRRQSSDEEYDGFRRSKEMARERGWVWRLQEGAREDIVRERANGRMHVHSLAGLKWNWVWVCEELVRSKVHSLRHWLLAALAHSGQRHVRGRGNSVREVNGQRGEKVYDRRDKKKTHWTKLTFTMHTHSTRKKILYLGWLESWLPLSVFDSSALLLLSLLFRTNQQALYRFYPHTLFYICFFIFFI